MFQRFIWPVALLLSASFLFGCGAQTKSQRKFSREQTAAAIRTLENEGLVIGDSVGADGQRWFMSVHIKGGEQESPGSHRTCSRARACAGRGGGGEKVYKMQHPVP